MRNIWKSLLISLLTLSAFVVLLPSNAGAPGPGSGLDPLRTGEFKVWDSWYGTRFLFNYAHCDAVATVQFHGEFDYSVLPDGTLSVVMGMSQPGNRISTVLDGTYGQCPAW